MKPIATKLLLPAGILAAGVFMARTPSYATAAYAKKEGAKCVACHVAAGKKDLNDTGKCYKEHKHTDFKTCEAKK